MKYVNTGVVFQEIPGEVTLSINISGCPCHCPGCHSQYLWDDVGETLDEATLDNILKQYLADITCVAFMGGDADPAAINRMTCYLHGKYENLKTAWYTGKVRRSRLVEINNLDYLKVGPYIAHLGPLNKNTTNQRLYKIRDGKRLEDITHLFWK